ncbi:MAG: DNA alkylation repair protein [Akkermansiaceae bacterium]
MTVEEVITGLEALGNEQTKKTHLRHGATEPLFGVKVGDLKKVLKKTKKNHSLALDLYATGNSDAMYLAGMMADEKVVTAAQLKKWAKQAKWSMISNYTVAGLAGESSHALALGQSWIDDKKELIAAAGWCTLTNYLSITPDEEIDNTLFTKLLQRVVTEIHGERNEVKAAMNGYVIALASYVPSLTKKARQAAAKIGKVTVDQGNTDCKTPDAIAMIDKIEEKGRIGTKRKTCRC